MALIKCPKCGKEMSDRADRCPQCGTPIDEIKAAFEKIETDAPAATATSQPKKKNGMPTWAWILIIAGSLIIVGGIVFLCLPGKSTTPNTIQENQEVLAIEADVAPISYPNITAQGVEPFLLGSSMYDIPGKGSFYDTILLEKRYNAFEECGEIHFNDLSEEELLKIKKEWGDILLVESYGNAYVMKDNDALIKIVYDDHKGILSIEVLSEQIDMQNGIHVGLSATEMMGNYNAQFIAVSPYNSELGENGKGDDMEFVIPGMSRNISIMAFSEDYSDYISRLNETREIPNFDYDTLPLDVVKGNSVRIIRITQ